MKNHYKIIITLTITLLTISANAQWYKLRPYPNPDSNNTNYYAGTPILPQAIGDGDIFFITPDNAISGNSGGAYILNSQNDLLTSSINFYISTGLGSVGILFATSRNDSVICFGYTASFIPNLVEYLYYTKDNFKSFDTIKISKASFFPYNSSPAEITNNFAYATPLFTVANSNDTLIVDRFNIHALNDTVFRISGYLEPGVMHFINDSVGFLSCMQSSDTTRKVLLQTFDFGKSWKTCFTDSIDSITNFYFPSSNIGYLIESSGSIFKTTNAGSNWSKLTSPTSKQLNCVSFTDDSLGYIGGNNGMLYKTVNGGATWTTEISGTKNNIVALYTFGTGAYFKDDTGALYKNVSPMGIQNITSCTPTIIVYPNPSKGIFHFQPASGQQLMANSHIEIYNLLGENIATMNSLPLGELEWAVDISIEPNGIYFYRIVTNSGSELSNGKLILNK